MNHSQKVPSRVFVFLALGLVAVSQSGNIIRLGQTHPVAIAAWRLLFASLLLAPFAGKRLRHLARLDKSERWLLVLAGGALFFHFYSWIAAVQHTTVANAAMAFPSIPSSPRSPAISSSGSGLPRS